MRRPSIHIACSRTISREFISFANLHGVMIHCYDFLKMYPKTVSEFEDVLVSNKNPLVFTSSHAVEAVKPILQKLYHLNAFAIEGKTSKCAQEQGFNLLDTAADATQLARKIQAAGTKGVLHCTTSNRRDELKNCLQSDQIQYQAVEVYNKETVALKAGYFDGVMFFSPSQVDAFLTLNPLEPSKPAFCIGNTTAQHLSDLHHQNIQIANQSTVRGLFRMVLDFYQIQNEQHTFTA